MWQVALMLLPLYAQRKESWELWLVWTAVFIFQILTMNTFSYILLLATTPVFPIFVCPPHFIHFFVSWVCCLKNRCISLCFLLFPTFLLLLFLLHFFLVNLYLQFSWALFLSAHFCLSLLGPSATCKTYQRSGSVVQYVNICFLNIEIPLLAKQYKLVAHCYSYWSQDYVESCFLLPSCLRVKTF